MISAIFVRVCLIKNIFVVTLPAAFIGGMTNGEFYFRSASRAIYLHCHIVARLYDSVDHAILYMANACILVTKYSVKVDLNLPDKRYPAGSFVI